MKYNKLMIAIAALSLTATNGISQIFTSGHGDIGVGYDTATDQFEPHWHLHGGAVVDGSPLASDAEYEPGDLTAQTSATRNSPSGLSDVIGVADGTSIYAAGSSTYQPNIGFGTEELAPTDWTTAITVSLTGWTLPTGTADFALYTTNLADTTVVDKIFSTHDATNTFASNSFTMNAGDHLHFQWGFTEMGTYDFTFQWQGTHATDGLITTSETFSVEVVPETRSLLLLFTGLFALWSRRRRS